ncbi:hypothetical protein FQR65_LT14186 [Abscondita terminalis]|nr:hypothetical protein FQR65_LT14186 [Abscondita terminalis]
MCSQIKENKYSTQNSKGVVMTTTSNDTQSAEVINALPCQSRNGEILLQTLMVKVNCASGARTARLVIDTASTRSYIRTNLAKEMKLIPSGQRNLQHVVFGGKMSKIVTHNQFKIELFDKKCSKKIEVNLLDQEVICGSIPRLTRGPWLKELSEKRIWVSDFGEGQPPQIDILIGGDNIGKFITTKYVHLRCGLIAQETILGWTLTDELPSEKEKINTPKELETFRTEAKKIMTIAGIDLRMWENTAFDGECDESSPVTTVLGLKWNKQEDTLYCDIP